MLGCRIAASLLLAVLTSGTAFAQAQPLEYYSQRIQSVSRVLVETVRPTLDERARKVLDEIEFQAPLSWETNAEARRAFGHRRIVEFNAGFLAGRLRGLDLRDALQLANRVGALSTRRAGGLAGLPRIRFAHP